MEEYRDHFSKLEEAVDANTTLVHIGLKDGEFAGSLFLDMKEFESVLPIQKQDTLLLCFLLKG